MAWAAVPAVLQKVEMSSLLSHRHVWLIPLTGALAVVALLTRGRIDTAGQYSVGIISVCGALAAASHLVARKHNDDDQRPADLLYLTAAAGLAAVAAALPPVLTAQNQMFGSGASYAIALAYLIAAVVAAVTTVNIVAFRSGARAKITERESGIFAAGIGFGFFVVWVQDASATPIETIFAVVNSTATATMFFSLVLVIWLITHDSDRTAVPLILIAAAQAALTVAGVGLTLEMTEPHWAHLFAIVGFVLLVASYLHPAITTALAPAVINVSEVNVRRSLTSFSVVLAGPILLGVGQHPDLNLDSTTITLGSSALSVAVALHLLGLVKRWAEVEHEGQHDPLTSLPNRPLFFRRLELTIESARLRDVRFVVMFLDLDRFKAVNDTLGHEAGDELLRQVASRLDDAAERVGPALTVARLGGDEFAIIVPQVKDPRHSRAIGRLFLDQFLEPFDVGLRDIYVTPSIGIAQYPTDGRSVEQLIENADTAMFEAKERGRNTVVSYSPDQRVPGAHRLEIEAALHRAIEREELELYFQPQIDITTGRIFAVESLLRWVHPTLGRISPEKFVPVAEESSLIDQIGKWTIEEACRQAARWADIGLPPINVAVNLSPRQFQKSVHLTDNVARSLRSSGLPPARLELELTESLALEKPEEVNETLIRFREMGIRTAIDDFGVGHTGLDYLDRIEVDTLKIDRSFINRIGESGAPLVTAVISLARGLNLDVIAEGVETRAQVNFLASHGCRYMQGYLFSKPLTGPQLEQVLRNQMRRYPEDANAGHGSHGPDAATPVVHNPLPEHATPDVFSDEAA